MNVQILAKEFAVKAMAIKTEKEGQALIIEMLSTIGDEPKVVSLMLAYMEDDMPFSDAIGLFRIMERVVPGVDRHIGHVFKNDLWFNDKYYLAQVGIKSIPMLG